LPDVFSASGLAACGRVDELFRPGGFVLALIGLVLLVLWLLGFVAFHVTTGVIHILLILAIISIIMHFLRGRTVA
jgi:membrane protein implicated in regulation of membrane protease activity